jgi:hypothetical protein
MVIKRMFLAFYIAIDFMCLIIDTIQMTSALTHQFVVIQMVVQFELKIEFSRFKGGPVHLLSVWQAQPYRTQ